MSMLVRCDSCARRALCAFIEGRWITPSHWKDFPLDDWEAHACSPECFEAIKTLAVDEPTPTSSTGTRLP